MHNNQIHSLARVCNRRPSCAYRIAGIPDPAHGCMKDYYGLLKKFLNKNIKNICFSRLQMW